MKALFESRAIALAAAAQEKLVDKQIDLEKLRSVNVQLLHDRIKELEAERDTLKAAYTRLESGSAILVKELETRLEELEASRPITFVMHPDDPNIKLLRDGTHIILQRKLPAYE